MPRKNENLTRENLERLIAEGKTCLDAMKELGSVSHQTIRGKLREFGIKVGRWFFKGTCIRPGAMDRKREEMSTKFSGEGNPFHGKNHSKKTRKKMSKNHADFKGEKNPFRNSLKDPKKRRAHKKRCKENWAKRDAAWRKRFGKKLSNRPISQNNPRMHRNHKSGHITTRKAGRLFYRSSWEKAMMKALDSCRGVASFEYEAIRIPYKDSDGKHRNTVVDFVVRTKTETVYLEVKPASLLNYGLNPDKMRAIRKHCKRLGVGFVIATGLECCTKSWVEKELIGG